jgi:hypothetical protein
MPPVDKENIPKTRTEMFSFGFNGYNIMNAFRAATTKDENIKRCMSVSPNAFFNSFYLPYALHGDLVLSPDDIWLAITMSFSEYVNDHAEELRK